MKYSWLAFVFLGATQVSAAELEVGHFVTSQKNCEALRNVDAKSNIIHIWHSPGGGLVYGGDDYCRIKGSKLVCDGAGDTAQHEMPMKIAKDGLSFQLGEQNFALCKSELPPPTNELLPLKTGAYVMGENACENAPNLAITMFHGDRFTTHDNNPTECRIVDVKKSGRAYAVTTSCRDVKRGKVQQGTSLYTLKATTGYSISFKPGGPSLTWKRCGPSIRSLQDGM